MSLDLRDPRLKPLFEPVAPLLRAGLDSLGAPLAVPIEVGETAGFYALNAGSLRLSPGLLAGTHHPLEPGGLDRWRRAIACALEAAALLQLGEALGRAPGADWRWMGWAIAAAHHAAPQLGLWLPDLALARASGSPGEHPRAGAAVMWAWEARGEDARARMIAAIRGEDPSPGDWLRVAEQVDAAGGEAALWAAGRAAPLPLPAELGPWSWRRVQSESARGGRLHIAGEGAVREPWIGGGEARTALVAATGGARVTLQAGAPVGSWELASLHGFGGVMGARGTMMEIAEDGRLEFTLADSFVGPIAALDLAATMGTSGVVLGRWRVCGPGELRMSGLRPHGLTVHGRGGMAVPAAGEREGWIAAIQTDPWRWVHEEDRLVLRGQMFGNAVELRWRRG